jgi:phenylacetate-CoA ligase
MQTVAYASTLLARREVFGYRDEALRDWMLPGGIEAVRAAVLARLKVGLDHARSSNTYYAALFASIGFDPFAMRDLEDICELPVMTKDDIREHRSDFDACESTDRRRITGNSGGSTGRPLAFSMSRDDYLRSIGVRLAGWHLCGYVLGDRIAIFGAQSMVKRESVPWRVLPSDFVLNRRQFSAADLDDARIAQYWGYMERWQPAYLRGYPTAIAEFCRHRPMTRRGHFRPRAVLTTSEVLTPIDRHIIEDTLEAPVFDGWGLNDGGASAYECEQHAGLHVDTTRSYVEVVDNTGHSVWGKPGRIIVTSLANRAFPFVRYDTGDMGVLDWRQCACGRTGLMLTHVLGRSNDMLVFGDARISPSSLGPLFMLEHLRRYRVVQDGLLHITVIFDVEPGFDSKTAEEAMTRAFLSRCPMVSIDYTYAPLPLPADGSKWRSVVVLDSVRTRTDVSDAMSAREDAGTP